MQVWALCAIHYLLAKPNREEAVRILREQLDDDEAEMLADRYLTADRTQGHRPDIAGTQRRFFKGKGSKVEAGRGNRRA